MGLSVSLQRSKRIPSFETDSARARLITIDATKTDNAFTLFFLSKASGSKDCWDSSSSFAARPGEKWSRKEDRGTGRRSNQPATDRTSRSSLAGEVGSEDQSFSNPRGHEKWDRTGTQYTPLLVAFLSVQWVFASHVFAWLLLSQFGFVWVNQSHSITGATPRWKSPPRIRKEGMEIVLLEPRCVAPNQSRRTPYSTIVLPSRTNSDGFPWNCFKLQLVGYWFKSPPPHVCSNRISLWFPNWEHKVALVRSASRKAVSDRGGATYYKAWFFLLLRSYSIPPE